MSVAKWMSAFQRTMLQRAYRTMFQSGERLVAANFSLGDGDYWFVTDVALYVFPTPSRKNRLDADRPGWRIPLHDVVSCEVIERGTFRERHVSFRDEEQRGSLTTCYDGPSGREVDVALQEALRRSRAG